MTQMRSYDDVLLNLSTLASETALKIGTKMDSSRENGFIIKKQKIAISINGLTDAEGPILVGMTNTRISAAEVAECINADPQSPLDVPAQERSMREVYPIMVFALWTTTKDPAVNEIRNEYRALHYPWKEIPEGTGLDLFAMNRGGGALTTGAAVNFQLTTIGEWSRD